MKPTIRLLTPNLWPALEDLFCDSAVCSRCWCMYWRSGNGYRIQPATANKSAFRRVVVQGPPPGLVALDGDAAVGWCQLTPRAALPQLERSWRLKRVDDLAVWSISCFYVRKSHRKQGLTSLMISAAVQAARRANAPALEAYPLDRDVTPSATSTGLATTFSRAGFKIVARHVLSRPIMRFDLKSHSTED